MKTYTNFTKREGKNRLYAFLILMISTLPIFSQNVGINSTGNAPNTNAGLDVDFSNKGVLIPRVALTNTASFLPLSAHVAGMIIYNTATTGDVKPGFYYNNGFNWVSGFPTGTATGNMLYWNGNAWLMIPPGLPGQFLQLNASNLPYWGGATGSLATLTTTVASAITTSTATTGGNITNDAGLAVLSRGVCYGTSSNPTTVNSVVLASPVTGTGSFTSSLTGLLPVTTYYVRAFATNNTVTTYATEISFTTLANSPTVTTAAAGSITGSTAVSGGNVTSDGGAAITERGIVYSISGNPTILTGTKIIDAAPGTGSYSSNISGLSGGTLYHVRAYATNSINTSYGSDLTFTTAVTPPTLVTVAATNISGASVTSGGSMNWNGAGYQNYQAYGVAYSTSSNAASPTKVATNSSNGSVNPAVNIAPWVTNISGLAATTTYYLRSYLDLWRTSTSSWITVYGPEISFTTTAPTAPVMGVTTAASLITGSTATTGGTITSDGGSTITAKGVVWGLTPNPTLGASNFTSNGSGVAAFTSNITGLSGSTIYYVRAYATNSIGTTYGPTDLTFTTNAPSLYTLGQNVNYGYVAYIAADGSGFIVSPDIALSGAGWGCSGTSIATGTALGTGKANTDLILATCATRPIAASLAKAYNGGGFNDWYLPSSGEWSYISATASYNLVNSNGYNDYYTSSQSNATSANTVWVTGGYIGGSSGSKTGDTYAYRVRAIRDFAAPAPVAPTVLSTTAISAILATSASSGGYISSDGGAAVSARGVCYGTSASPDITGTKTTNGTGMGSFTSPITGLSTGLTYYVRAYATNSAGTSYGPEVTFVPNLPGYPIVTTDVVTAIASDGGTSGGNVTSEGSSAVTARGVCWSISPTAVKGASNFTTNGTGLGTFPSTITGLTMGTLYYVRAYATNSAGTAYGNEVSFTTAASAGLATLSTNAVTAIHGTSGTSGGVIISNGGNTVTSQGVCWGTTADPIIGATNFTNDAAVSSTFTSTITGLTTGLLYHIRAYAITSAGTSYGNDVTFTPTGLAIPIVTTTAISNLTGNTVKSGGNVTSDGGDPIIWAGVVYSTTPHPDINTGTSTFDGNGTGSFVSNLTGLTTGQLYYLRAYAYNLTGTAYGNEISFTPTGAGYPTVVTTATISTPTANSGTAGGQITSDGGATVTAYGICWKPAIGNPPTILDSKTVDATIDLTGTFTSTMTGLVAGTQYAFSAYATNSLGTSYGNMEYYTPVGPPNVGAGQLFYWAGDAFAQIGLNITDGGSPLTAVGAVWNTSPNPTIAVNGGISTEILAPMPSTAVIQPLTLVPSTTYYIRTYATNSIGTSYSPELIFTPGVAGLPTVQTNPILNKVGALAEGSGTVLFDGGNPITDQGLCWSTTVDPTIASNIVAVPNIAMYGASNPFYCNITGLTIGTTYHVRAYATNDGTNYSYGADVSFVATAAYVGQVLNSTGGFLWGGSIFSVDGTGAHGLIAIPYSYGLPTDWGCSPSTVLTSTAVGTGLANTNAIIADISTGTVCTSANGPGSFAAEMAAINYLPGWYLPSKDELSLMWTKRTEAQISFAGMTTTFWSSSQDTGTNAWAIDATTGNPVSTPKTDLVDFIAIRSF
jgi:hypothetical protein